MYAQLLQLCPTLCNPIDGSPPGSSVHGIFQKRILEWVAISSSRLSSQPRDQTRLSCIAGRFFYHWAIVEACCGSFHILFFLFICSHLNTVIGLWRYCYYLLLTTQHLEQCLKAKMQVAQSCPTLYNLMTIQSMEFFRPEYWSGYPFPSPGDLPNPGIEPRSPSLQADSLPAEPQGKPKNTGVGSLSLLQQIFPMQESNWGLLHCRRILYQLSYQGSMCLAWIVLGMQQILGMYVFKEHTLKEGRRKEDGRKEGKQKRGEDGRKEVQVKPLW